MCPRACPKGKTADPSIGCKSLIPRVGAIGFEPTTSRSRTALKTNRRGTAKTVKTTPIWSFGSFDSASGARFFKMEWEVLTVLTVPEERVFRE